MKTKYKLVLISMICLSAISLQQRSMAGILHPFNKPSNQHPDTSKTTVKAPSAERDGQHDFDFEIGTWKTTLKRLDHPLTGSNNWIPYEGTTVVHKIWNGSANMVELEVDGPSGHISALNLRLYDAEAHQWTLNFSRLGSGTIGQPTVGEFKNGRGEFFDQETYRGRFVFVRFIITEIDHDTCHFEQSFSDDNGKTWELNWVATDTRVK